MIRYVLAHADRYEGYRSAAYKMIAAGICCLRPMSVYRIIREAGIIKKWAEASRKQGRKGFEQPKKPDEQWHIDISYVKVMGAFYYFIGLMDGYSRKIISWSLCGSMDGINAEIVIARAKEARPGARARVIHDNGSQFVSKDFKKLISELELSETASGICHPQSNGKLERFHRTLKEKHVRQTPYYSVEDARAKIGAWISYYNNERLHGTIGYLTPSEVYDGKKEARLAERREKLYNADKLRQEYWQDKLKKVAY